MSIEIPSIFQGQTYVTADGNEFTVVDLNLQNSQVTIDDQDDRHGVMDLDDLLQAIRSGKFILVEDDGEDDEENAPEELDETDDEHDGD